MQSMLKKARDYIKLRQDMGCVFFTESAMLESFGEYSDNNAKGKPLTVKLAVEWAILPNGDPTYHASRLSALRPFARHLIVDDPRTELIPAKILGPCSSRVPPYLYSKDEVVKLMNTPVFPPEKSFGNATMSTVIGLLACTGLRIGEALSLKNKNIDWVQKTLLVQWSKKLPMRLVPIDQSTVEALQGYAKIRNKNTPEPGHDCFFQQYSGKRIIYQNFHDYWAEILRMTEVGKNHSRQVRLHDLRHTFACNHLLRAYESCVDIHAAIHALSIYLGHSSPKSTYWYLSIFPPLFEHCSKKFEKHVLSRRKELTRET